VDFEVNFRLAGALSVLRPNEMSSDRLPSHVPDEAALRAIVHGVEAETGERFFTSLVQNLAFALSVQYAFVTQISDDGTRFRMLAVWERDHFGANIELPLNGTPCESVLHGQVAHHAQGLCALFPEDKGLVDWRAESYCGVPVFDSDGRVFGHVAIIDDKPMPDGSRGIGVMRIFAARVRAEVERLRTEEALREANQRLAQSEERLRDLFEEAPIAYVHESLDSRFIRANRTALRILGMKPEEVPGMFGKSLVPNTEDAQRRLHEALDSIGRGTDTSGIVLELRRKDDGRPIWIEWWSRPEPGGEYTRTMFIDITDRVLMEQEKSRLETQNEYLREEIKQSHNFEEIVGKSPALNAVLDKVRLVATTDSTVLILGDTGTGKELIARAIHSASSRHDRPLINVNCAALPSGLIESELFGHEKGAFTGATEKRTGRFELANGGTIFLDEIGEIPPEVQLKLLRVLQEREFERIGDSRSIKVNIRVIAATNRDLNQAVADGKFRRDLFYRLNVFPLVVPPLRDRREDIPLLVHYFVRRYASRIGRNIHRIPADTMARLVAYFWPGNIRELENVIERAVILSAGPDLELAPELLPRVIVSSEDSATGQTRTAEDKGVVTARDRSFADNEKGHILKVLRQTNWRIEGPKGAAAILKLNPSTLRSRMKKLGVERSREGAS
jgi:PAS domain S-box-containing protein